MPRRLQTLNLSGADDNAEPDNYSLADYPWWVFVIEGLILLAIVLGAVSR